MNQRLVIMQGVPGSGKSSRAKHIASQDERTVVVSTDDQCHDEQGRYDWRPELMGQRHKRTQNKAAWLLRLGVSVVIDNTNLANWEVAPYVKVAYELGVPVEFVRCEGQFQNTHGVPPEKVDQMWKRMETLSVEAALAQLKQLEAK